MCAVGEAWPATHVWRRRTLREYGPRLLTRKIPRTDGEHVDFVQVAYSITDTLAEERILPTALDTGTAVIVRTPFESGALFRRVKDTQLPPWAVEHGIHSWSQFFLAWILGHPAVTCPIPATSSRAHIADNVSAGQGPLPDAKLRGKMREVLEAS